ncbi:MAG: hypothetical protein H6879_10305, partial [Rhodobiaceae bacterium]|nr:hypothetical protein [Rhodobiaceae bacterium]
PIARVVVRRAAKRAASLDQFHDSLAGEVAEPADRNALLGELRRLG